MFIEALAVLDGIDNAIELNGIGLNKLDKRPEASWRTSEQAAARACLRYRRQLPSDVVAAARAAVGNNAPTVKISADFAVSLEGFCPKEKFADYLHCCKQQLSGKYLPDSKAWRIRRDDVEKCIAFFERDGFIVLLEEPESDSVREARVVAEQAKARTVELSFDGDFYTFRLGCFNAEFNDVFSNVHGETQWIFGYEPRTHARQTTSILAAREAASVLSSRGFMVVQTSRYQAAEAAYQARMSAFSSMDSAVSALIAPDVSLYAHQNRAVKFLEQANGNALLGMCMGCIDGEASVTVNRAGRSFKISLKELHRKFQGGESNKRVWDKNITTRIRCYFNGILVSMPIENTFYRGKKETVKITLEDGKTLVATPDHPVLTKKGWKRADSILGEVILTNGTEICKICNKNPSTHGKYAKEQNKGICKNCLIKLRGSSDCIGSDGYIYVKAHGHPHMPKVRGNAGIPQHRLIMEAHLNGLSYDDYIKKLQSVTVVTDFGFTYIGKDKHVHHKNGNKSDNRLENLEVLDAKEHLTIHADVRSLPIFIPKESQCISVEKHDDIDVYDVRVPEADTFVANGIIVHNSGKTLVSLAHIAKNGLKAIVICPKVMRRTWTKEAQKFFSRYFKDVVELRTVRDIKRVTNETTLISCNYESASKYKELVEKYGFSCVVVDESHYIKNQKTKRFYDVNAISSCASIRSRILLSGTAVKNNRYEIIPQISILSEQKAEEISGIKYLGDFWHGIQDCYLSMPKSEVLAFLPQKRTERNEFEVKQPCGLPGDISEITKYKHDCATSKIEATCELLEEILESSDENVLVFSEFLDVVEAVKAKFGELAIMHHGQLRDDVRENAKEAFQKSDSTARIFVSTRPSLAVGATLTRASRVIFNDLPWNMADIQQAEDRTHRIGQINPVVVHWVVAENSEFDSKLTDIIEQKAKIQKAVTEGKKLTKEELDQLQTAVSFNDLIKARSAK